MLNETTIVFGIFLLGLLPAFAVAATDRPFSTSFAGVLIAAWTATMAVQATSIKTYAREWLDSRASACVSPQPQPVASTAAAPL
ncbi:hypothetical protein V5F50_19670 [Xanthobacter sp. V13C-7B]|uniref:hypothetical protein n=1 Tax=Xanthobacter variabilis TaxID=3119932 RepID=UPI0037293FE5